MANEQPIIWHQGELAIQQRAGTDKQMDEVGPRSIRSYMPTQHRDFFQSLSMLFIGYSGYDSSVLASVVFGVPGFIVSPNETELVINTQYSLGDLFNNDLEVGTRIGLLGIEFSSKRRNRVNAMITAIDQKTITVSVLQSYGNCPKYIQPKRFLENQHYGAFSTTHYRRLTQTDKQLIARSDSFFIASYFDDGRQLNNRGADISHRGGRRGFVSITTDGLLQVEDYAGNGFFNTLGNLQENPIASLLFCDWQTGVTLRIQVTSEILWSDELQLKKTISSVPKKTRCLSFTPIKIERFNNGLAYRLANSLQ